MTKRKSCFLDRIKTLFVSVMFLFSANVSFSQWTFTPQIRASGCSDNSFLQQINTQLISQFRLVGIPTKAECEQIRSQVLSVSSGYDGCVVYYTCSPCTGSDIVSPTSGSGIGTGVESGGANFTPSDFESVNMWIQDWQQKNASLNNAVDITNLITGDNAYDDVYTKEMDKMVTEKRTSKVDRDASADYVWGVVDPNYLKQWDPDKIEKTLASGRGVKQVVAEEKTDAVKTASQSSLASAVPIPEGGVSDNIDHPKIDAVTNIAKNAVSLIGAITGKDKGIGAGTQILLNANINLYSELAKAYDEGLNHGKIVTTTEILSNAVNNTISDAKEMVIDAVTSDVTSTISTYGVKGALKLSGQVPSKAAIEQGVSLVTNASDLISDPLGTTIKAGAEAAGSKIIKKEVDGEVFVKSFKLGQDRGDLFQSK